MDSVNLEPRYGTNQIVGRCVRCLAQEELNKCLRELLASENNDEEELQKKYMMMITFLQSEESEKLVAESEKLLAEGKKVNIKLSFTDGKLEYNLEIN
jgi:hypothetical protein